MSALETNELNTINRQIENILEKAPSDSEAELLIEQGPSGYKALFKIYSTQRRFVGAFRSSALKDVLDHVFSEVRLQIEDWKKVRTLLDVETS